MREIKFRAWLPKARRSTWSGHNPPDRRKFGRMLDFDQLYFSISNDSLQHPQIFTDTPEHFYGEDIERSQEGAILLQYTGLKDKRGVEIYEGDIVTYKVGTLRVKGPVYYSDEWATWFKHNNQNLSSYKKTTEVIGNIYENPELLNA